jgi:hypothetical protein
MIMKRIAIYLFLLLFVVGCKEQVLGPVSSDGLAPGVVTDVKVQNMAGGAVIEYKIPNDNDLLYVKAVYTITNGKTLEAKASMYERTLTVKGFNDADNTHEYTVSLTCLDRSNNESAPVTVKVNPMISPLQMVKNSVAFAQAFGGVRYSWENEVKEPITLFFMADTVVSEGKGPGALVETRIINTDQAEGEYISRGFPDKAREFAVVLQDNYGNKTEVIKPSATIVPLNEEVLDKSKMKVFEYKENPVDDKWNWWEGLPRSLIDGSTAFASCAISYQSPYPRHITIDMGKTYKLSRYVMHQRRSGTTNLYAYGNPKTWYVYGRKEAPVTSEEITEDLDGDGLQDWTKHWTLVGYGEIAKVSGLPGSEVSQEDIDAALNGHNYDVPMSMEPFRYFRLGVLSNWGNTGWVNWAEMDFFGVEM